ncbi:tyrosine-type recombinase/integrase [Acinetobacter brisouii]
MARQIKPLSSTQCDGAKPKEKDYNLYDGQGLILFVRKNGSKVWRFKYKRPNGKDGLMTLGNYPALTLKEARGKRHTLLNQLANGIDPIDQLAIQKAKHDDSFSFEAVTRAWHVAYKATGKWGDGTAERALKNFEIYVFPELGNKPIDSIKPRDLNFVLSKIEEKGYLEVLKKTRQRFVSIFAFAISKGYIELSPAYSLKDAIIVTRKTKHHPKLPLTQLPELFKRLQADQGHPLTGLCLEFALHTFARSSELRFARWNEFDLKKGIWTIPPERTLVEGYKFSNRGAKMKTPHLIPLSPQALRIISEIHSYSGIYNNVFPKNGDPHGFMSESTINNTLRRMGYDTNQDICGHGFRGMACGALIESTLFTEDAVEKQMSHQERNGVRQAYIHHAEFMEERRMMLCWWSDYLEANQEKFISPMEFSLSLMEQAKQGVINIKYAKLIKLKLAEMTNSYIA